MHGHVTMALPHLVANASKALGDKVDDLTYIEHNAEGRGSDHEVGEDLLLSGVADVAVHLVGAGCHLTLDQPGQVEAVVDVVEDVEEADLYDGLDEEADQVGPPQATMLLARIVVQLDFLTVLGAVLALAFISVCHVHDHHEGGACDEDELQSPQPYVGDGEVVVVADIGTARLLCVAVKVLLLIAPYSLCCHHIHHHPEYKHHGQPYPTERCGVLVHPAEEGLEGLPVHDLSLL